MNVYIDTGSKISIHVIIKECILKSIGEYNLFAPHTDSEKSHLMNLLVAVMIMIIHQ
jgi:hypothetical protein